MSTGVAWICFGAILIGLIAIAAAAIAQYNRLVTLRNRVDNAWAQIDVQLKRRYDLIPNLVNTVKGYAEHESSVFEDVTNARAAAMTATGPEAQAAAENQLSATLKSLFAVAEAYPDLKANQNFLNLQDELSNTESKIAFARQFYNDSVLMYNTSTQTFPSNVIASIFGFKLREYFEAEAAAAEPPTVRFDDQAQ